MQTVCTPICAMKTARKVAMKENKATLSLERRQLKEKRESLKTLPQLTKEAQAAFNGYIRERDQAAGHGCICCPNPLDWGTVGVRGHAVDAGHYRSTGSAPHLRFNADNCHAQRVVCNRHGSGRAVDYRLGLIARIGLARVEALESDNSPRKFTRDELRQIRDHYRAKARELRKCRERGHTPPPDSGSQLGACIV
jgi:hypothetical protein